MSTSSPRGTSTACDNDKLWIEEFLNMDDIEDDDDEYCSDFGQTCTNNLLLLPHDHQLQIQGGDKSTFKISSSPTPTSTPKSNINNNNIANKRRKVRNNNNIAHITVERNRRKQMNHNLSLLRSLMPSFYVKRGDQASIIGGVIDYINELQLLLQSLEANKRNRKLIHVIPSPRKPPLSPRLIQLPITPTTPQSSTPYYNPPPPPTSTTTGGHYSPTLVLDLPSSSSNVEICVNELAASSKSAMANVEVKFSGENNLLLKTASPKIPGQALKIISTLEKLALEILHVSVSTINDDTMLNSFTIKIGIECQLSAEELAHQVQQTFF